MRLHTNAYLRGAQGYFLKNFKKVRKSQVAGIEKIVVVGVSGMFRGRVELFHAQRVFRCGLPHARRHVVLVVARVSVVAVRRVRGVISVTVVLMAAVLLGLGVFVPPLVRVDLVDGLPGRHRSVVAVLLFFFFQGILNVIVVGLWRRFEQLLVESAQPLCPLAKT